MIDHMMNDDVLSLSMFWAGVLMVFTPLLTAGTVVAFLWRERVRQRRAAQLPDTQGD
jgi:hypothetical protein